MTTFETTPTDAEMQRYREALEEGKPKVQSLEEDKPKETPPYVPTPQFRSQYEVAARILDHPEWFPPDAAEAKGALEIWRRYALAPRTPYYKENPKPVAPGQSDPSRPFFISFLGDRMEQRGETATGDPIWVNVSEPFSKPLGEMVSKAKELHDTAPPKPAMSSSTVEAPGRAVSRVPDGQESGVEQKDTAENLKAEAENLS